jgi:hypothetical protein
MLAKLVASEDRGFALGVDQITGEGADLAWHWQNKPSRNAIQKKHWDYVVLQDRSGGPLAEPQSFARHAGLLDAEIRKHGALTLMFLTWANQSRPETQAILTDAYKMTAAKLHADLAPVGVAWETLYRLNPEIELHHRDGRHANPVGSYLTACVFYAVLFQRSPLGLPASFYFKNKMWLDLTKDKAALLQKTAWETVSTLCTV